MNSSAKSVLAPVYPALADWIVDRYELEERKGIGLDIGGGPGDLVVALCRRTAGMYWVNVDINTYGFMFMHREAAEKGICHCTGAIFGDVHALPFQDDYADIVLSRGAFQFWEDWPAAFAEIYRVLKPGGTAFVGRGYSENLPPEVAAAIRDSRRAGGPEYDIPTVAGKLKSVMEQLEIKDYEIMVPSAPDDFPRQVKYGIWIEIRKDGL